MRNLMMAQGSKDQAELYKIESLRSLKLGSELRALLQDSKDSLKVLGRESNPISTVTLKTMSSLQR